MESDLKFMNKENIVRKVRSESENYRCEIEFIARYFKTSFSRIWVYVPLLLMTYSTAAQLMRRWGMSEYERGYNDAQNNSIV
jgi:hypothetical protein